MKKRQIVGIALLFWVIWGGQGVALAQQTPDTILYNGKVVTVNNHEVNPTLGTIAQALAVKGDTILAVGDNARIRAMAGPSTRSIDLKGRTVMPSFGATHDHPIDRKSTRLNSSHIQKSRMPSSA